MGKCGSSETVAAALRDMARSEGLLPGSKFPERVSGDKPSPAPWRIETGSEWKIMAANGQTVMAIGDGRRLIPMPTDARLLQAAPALLEACENMLWKHNNRQRLTKDDVNMASAAIAQVGGAR